MTEGQAISHPTRTMFPVLMLAVFTVSLGYGLVLPVLPALVEQLLPGADQAAAARHTGLLTAAYTFGMFIFAPVWGLLSDRYGRRGVLLIGLVGFGSTLPLLTVFAGVDLFYAERFLSGSFAAAITPVASAAIGDYTIRDQERAQRLAWTSMAGIAGIFLGPMLGATIVRLAPGTPTSSFDSDGPFALPLIAVAALAFATAAGIARTVPERTRPDTSRKSHLAECVRPAVPERRLVSYLLAITLIVASGIGAFEVGLALRGAQVLGMDPVRIGLMFAECSLVMFVAQAVVFSPIVKPNATRWLIGPALVTMAAGLFAVPSTSDPVLTFVVVGIVAASAGILSPILTYWISLRAGDTRGAELGKQTSAASLGQTLGSGAGGLLFSISIVPGAAFTLPAVVLLLAAMASLRLPRVMARAGSAVPFPPSAPEIAMEQGLRTRRQRGRPEIEGGTDEC